MVAAFVQGAKTHTGATDPIVVTFGSDTTSGNLIVVLVQDDSSNTGSVLACTDNYSNTYNTIHEESDTSTTTTFYAYAISGGPSHTISVDLDFGLTSNVSICVQEFTGILTTSDPLDKIGDGVESNTSTPSSNVMATTSQANELIVGFFGGAGLSVTATAGAPYGDITAQSRSQASSAIESRVVSATGAYNPTFSLGAAEVCKAVAATFRAAPYSAPPRSLKEQAVMRSYIW